MSRVELDLLERKADWEEVKFDDLFDRLVSAGIVRNQSGLADLLRIGRAAVSYVAKKGYVPREWKVRLERAGVSWEWVSTGLGTKYNPNRLIATNAIVTIKQFSLDSDTDNIPQSVQAEYEIPLHKTFLTRQGVVSNSLSYFVQRGPSMQPLATDGDVWVVDEESSHLEIGSIYLVGVGSGKSLLVRIILNIDSINNTATLGCGNPAIPHQVIDVGQISVYGRCMLKICKVV